MNNMKLGTENSNAFSHWVFFFGVGWIDWIRFENESNWLKERKKKKRKQSKATHKRDTLHSFSSFNWRFRFDVYVVTPANGFTHSHTKYFGFEVNSRGTMWIKKKNCKSICSWGADSINVVFLLFFSLVLT